MKYRVTWTWPELVGGFTRVYIEFRVSPCFWRSLESRYKIKSYGWQDISQRPAYRLDKETT